MFAKFRDYDALYFVRTAHVMGAFGCVCLGWGVLGACGGSGNACECNNEGSSSCSEAAGTTRRERQATSKDKGDV